MSTDAAATTPAATPKSHRGANGANRCAAPTDTVARPAAFAARRERMLCPKWLAEKRSRNSGTSVSPNTPDDLIDDDDVDADGSAEARKRRLQALSGDRRCCRGRAAGLVLRRRRRCARLLNPTKTQPTSRPPLPSPRPPCPQRPPRRRRSSRPRPRRQRRPRWSPRSPSSLRRAGDDTADDHQGCAAGNYHCAGELACADTSSALDSTDIRRQRIHPTASTPARLSACPVAQRAPPPCRTPAVR